MAKSEAYFDRAADRACSESAPPQVPTPRLNQRLVDHRGYGLGNGRLRAKRDPLLLEQACMLRDAKKCSPQCAHPHDEQQSWQPGTSETPMPDGAPRAEPQPRPEAHCRALAASASYANGSSTISSSTSHATSDTIPWYAGWSATLCGTAFRRERRTDTHFSETPTRSLGISLSKTVPRVQDANCLERSTRVGAFDQQRSIRDTVPTDDTRAWYYNCLWVKAGCRTSPNSGYNRSKAWLTLFCAYNGIPDLTHHRPSKESTKFQSLPSTTWPSSYEPIDRRRSSSCPLGESMPTSRTRCTQPT